MRRAKPTEIYFRCTACRRRLAIGVEGAGRLADCPNCAASLLVPHQSTTLPPQYVRLGLIVASQAAALAILLAVSWRIWNSRGTVSMVPRPPLSTDGGAEQSTASRPAAANPSASVPTAVAGRHPELEKQNRDLQAANRAMGKQYEELANWVLTNMRGRFPLKDRYMGRLKFSPVTGDFKVHPDIADFLGVDEREQGLLNDAFEYGRATMATLESNYLTATQPAPDRVTLHVPPFEQDGAALRDDLYRSLESVLGRTRFDRLLEVSEEDLVKNYHYFGSAAHTMIFQLTQPENSSEAPYLLIKDGWIIPNGPDARSISATESAVRELPKEYAAYLASLPDFVTIFARK